MSVVFAEQAYQRMLQLDLAPVERWELLDTLERMAEDPTNLQSEKVVRVRPRDGENAFIVRAGGMRAVLTVDPAKPEQIVVVGIYRGEDNASANGHAREPASAA